MTCRDIQNNLPAYLEDLLPPEEKTLIREHLAVCPQCGKALEDLKRMDTLLQNLEEVSPPPWLKQRIMARVREEAQPERGFFRKMFTSLRFRVPLQAVALLVITVLAFYLYRGEEPELRKNGIDIAPPAALQQRSPAETEKPSMAPPRTAAPRKKEFSARSEKTATAPSPPDLHKEPFLRQESPMRDSNQEKIGTPANGAVFAGRQDPAPEQERTGQKEKGGGQHPVGRQDCSGPDLPKHQVNDMPHQEFQALRSRTAIALQAGETDRRRTASVSPSAEMTRESKAESTAGGIAPGRDISREVLEITSLLRKFEAEKIESSFSGKKQLLTAVLPSRNLRSFLQKLDAQGETGRNVSILSADPKRGTIEIRIEIIGNP